MTTRLLDPDAPLEIAMLSDRDIAREIVKVMDGLPLALEQAGAYIEETECGLQGYLRLYQAQGVQLLKEHGEFAPDHPEPVATTWSLSFEKVEQANPAAAELLRFCAFLAPDAIPEELFTESAAELGPILEPVASSLSSLNTAIRELLKYSLVQEVLKDQMDEETQRLWAERTVRAVRNVFPNPEYTNWDRCRRYFLHAQVCSDLIEQWELLFTEAARLLTRLGYYLWQRGEYKQVESLDQRALAIHEKVLGAEHVDTATSLANLAFDYLYQDKYEPAEPLYLRVLPIVEKVYGLDHPDVASVLLNLAIEEKMFPPAHPYIALSLENYASLLRKMNRTTEAEPLEERARAIRAKRTS